MSKDAVATGSVGVDEGQAGCCAAAIEDLSCPDLYLNRELSWLKFNARVLDQALDPRFPLLEQLKFLAIFSVNLDEFFMVRVAGIAAAQERSALRHAGCWRLARQLAEIRKRVLALQETAYKHWKELSRQLAKKGVRFRRYSQLTEKQRKFLDDFFHTEVYPVLTPQAIDPAHPFPTISNLSINFIVQLQCPDNTIRFARLRCPSNVSRFVFVPRTKAAKDYVCLGLSSNLRDTDVILLEDLIRQYLETLFYGNKILACGLFRITRNTDLELAEEEADDLLEAIRDLVDQRRFGDVVRLEFASGVNRMLVDFSGAASGGEAVSNLQDPGALAFPRCCCFTAWTGLASSCRRSTPVSPTSAAWKVCFRPSALTGCSTTRTTVFVPCWNLSDRPEDPDDGHQADLFTG